MDTERWHRIKEIFSRAADLPAAERDTWLTETCGDDAALRAEVDSLLRADETSSALDRPLASAVDGLLPGHRISLPGRLGAYKVVREIGRGGMAVVYAARRDDDQYHKEVAIKLIKRGMDTDAIIARFRQERQILADLEHPNIARLLDGGVSDDGLPFLVMERIEGETLTEHCQRLGLSVERRIELFRTVCDAVQHAHRNLVVHRDLKPSNILVTAEGLPKLLDFGIAKLLAESTPSNLATDAGLRPMTPSYASPEQILGHPVTTTSDVYALGVLLFELLADQRPFPTGDLPQRELERVVLEQEPPRPSEVVAARNRRRLEGDLDSIVCKALEKHPGDRYGSVEQLSQDLLRHLEGLPIQARRATWLYRGGKFLTRYRWGVVAACLLFLSLVTGLLATFWQYRAADAQRIRAEWASTFLVDLFQISYPEISRGELVPARQLLDRGADRLLADRGNPPDVRARLLDTIGLAYSKLGLYEDADPLLREAHEIRRRGPLDHPLELADSETHLGELLHLKARYAEAETFHRRALERRQRALEPGAEAIIESLENLGVAVFRQQRFAEAEELLRRALAAEPEGLPRKTRPVVRNNLALVLKAQGRFEEAEALFRQALEDNHIIYGAQSPEIAINLNNLAQILRDQGRCDQALELYGEALQLHVKILGDRHPAVAVAQNNLASCLKELERFDEAEALYLSALDIRREGLGPRHPDVAATLNNLALLYRSRGDRSRSTERMRQALEIYRSISPPPPGLATTLVNLADSSSESGDLASAEILLTEVLDLRRDLFGDSHPAVASGQHRLARLLRRAGRTDEAAALFRSAYEIRREHLGPEHPETADSYFGLAVIVGSEPGHPAEAEPILRQGLELWRAQPEAGKTRIAVLESLLGGILTSAGRLEEAERLLVPSYEVFPDPRTRRRLAHLYEALGNDEKAALYSQPPADS